jgi:hypothetical protein
MKEHQPNLSVVVLMDVLWKFAVNFDFQAGLFQALADGCVRRQFARFDLSAWKLAESAQVRFRGSYSDKEPPPVFDDSDRDQGWIVAHQPGRLSNMRPGDPMAL